MSTASIPMRPTRHPGLAPLALLVLLLAGLTLPLILSGRGGTSEAYDQMHHHEPVIRAFAQSWPRVDLVHYDSATTPGYHLALAALARTVSSERVVLQLASWLFSLALIVVLYRQMARTMTPWSSALTILPFVASSYVLGSAVWLVTDNAALLFVALALGPCLSADRVAPLARAGLAAAAAVLIRQLHAWTAAPLALRALVEARRSGRGAALARVCFAILPLAVAGIFFMLWSGPTPPMHAARHAARLNPAVWPATLALLGLMGPLYAPMFLREWRELLPRRAWMWAIAGAAAAFALLVPTSFDKDAGRWGGAIWELARVSPAVGSRSLAITLLAPLGAMIVTMGCARAARAGRGTAVLVLLGAACCWLAAHSWSALAFQRYLEPMALLVLMWLAALAAPEDARRPRGWWLAPLALGLGQLCLCWFTLYRPALAGAPLA